MLEPLPPQLRAATRPRGSVGYLGVKMSGKNFVAVITVDGKTRHLGSFPDPISAAAAYDAEARRLRGEAAFLNFPGPGERGVLRTDEVCPHGHILAGNSVRQRGRWQCRTCLRLAWQRHDARRRAAADAALKLPMETVA